VQVGHWSPRRIGRWWLVGLSVECMLVLAPLIWSQLAPRAPLSPLEQQTQAFHAREDSVRRALLPPPATLSDSQRAELRALFRDSLGFEIVSRDGSIDFIPLTPEAHATRDAIARGVKDIGQQIGAALMVALLILAAIYLPVPLGLITLTLVWLWQRRRPAVGSISGINPRSHGTQP
jgi:hypothetical protein